MKDELLTFALSLPGSVADTPFDLDFETQVLRHEKSGKWYGIFLSAPAHKLFPERSGTVPLLNLKCDPEDSVILRQLYPDAIFPAYHMNKRLWISVLLEKTSLPTSQLHRLITQSYELTARPADRI